MRRLLAGALLLAAVGFGTPTATATSPDELPPSKDNATDVYAKKFCNASSKSGSFVIRRLPTGPLSPDHKKLAFTSGVCIYLPPGYGSSGLRYPVLYLLHGGSGRQSDWVRQGHVQTIADALYAKDKRNAMIIVMPDGGSGANWFDAYDKTYMNDSYVMNHLIPYVDRHFHTIADRAGRIIDGLSNGGYGALALAARHPDKFVSAGAMSANLGFRGDDSGQAPVESPSYKEGNLPAPLASNLDWMDVVMDIGASCMSDATKDACVRFMFEQLFRIDNRYFVGQMNQVKHKGVLDYRETEGGHAWWWWSKWLGTRHLPFLLKRAADPRPMSSAPLVTKRSAFRYRSVYKGFSVWGYGVSVTRDTREFLDLLSVTSKHITLRGSGSVLIRTAPIYAPGQMYYARGAIRPNLIADTTGRLEIAIDLGPSHTQEDASYQGRALQKTPNYWATKTIDLFRVS